MHRQKTIPLIHLGLLVMLITGLCLPFIADPVSAASGLSLSPFESIKVDLAPGEIVTRQVQIKSGEQEKTVDMAVDILEYRISSNGVLQAVNPGPEPSPYSARDFITVNKKSIKLAPRQSQVITITINVPVNTGDGGRYAVINLYQTEPDGTGTTAGALSAFNIPVLLTIKGSSIIQSAQITRLAIGEAVSNNPLEILTVLKNTGNHHFKCKGEINIQDSGGRDVGTVYLAPITFSLIPTMSVEFKSTFIPSHKLPAGTYTVTSRFMLEDGTLLDEASGNFTVNEPYTPPATPGTASPVKEGGLDLPVSKTKWALYAATGILALMAIAGLIWRKKRI